MPQRAYWPGDPAAAWAESAHAPAVTRRTPLPDLHDLRAGALPPGSLMLLAPTLRRRARESGILCAAYPSGLRLRDGEREDGACLAIEAGISDAQAARVLAALTRWTATLLADSGAHTVASARFGYDRIRGSAEIFGPDAAGGHVVRHDLSGSGWLLLVPAARPAAEPGPLSRGAGPTPPPERAPYLRRGRALRIRAS